MENIRRIAIFFIIVLATVGIFYVFKFSTYYTKAQFTEITEENLDFNLTIEKVLEFKSFYDTGNKSAVGEDLLAIIPYFYGGVPYGIAIVVVNKSDTSTNPGVTNVLEFRVYDLRYGEIIDRYRITDLAPGDISASRITYYTDESTNRVIITYYVRADMGRVYKVVVDKTNISEVKRFEYHNPWGEPGVLEYAMVVEGNGTDILFYLYTRSYDGKLAIWARDENGNNVIGLYYMGSLQGWSIYEASSFIVYTMHIIGAGWQTGHMILYDKINKAILDLGMSFGWGNDRTYIENTIGGYYDDIVIHRGNYFIGYARDIGRFEISNVPGMWNSPGYIRYDKILQVGKVIRGTYPNYSEVYISYNLLRYDKENNTLNIYSLNDTGVLVDFTQDVQDIISGITGRVGITILDKHVEILGLDSMRYIPILSSLYEDSRAVGCRGDVYLLLVDIDSKTVYRKKIDRTYCPQQIFYVTYHPRYLFYLAYSHKNESIIENTYRVYALSTYPIVQNVTKQQPQPQPGFDVVIITPETNITIPPYNVTQNVTTTRRTGIQSVIEIIGRNWWIILLAILLLILIAASLRRRAS